MGRNKDGIRAAGLYIWIFSDGDFRIGEAYADAKGAVRRVRYTTYYTDGTSEEFDQDVYYNDDGEVEEDEDEEDDDGNDDN